MNSRFSDSQFRYAWRAWNYKTREVCEGSEGSHDEACAKAEAAKQELGFRDTVATVTSFTGATVIYRPHARQSGRMVWAAA